MGARAVLCMRKELCGCALCNIGPQTYFYYCEEPDMCHQKKKKKKNSSPTTTADRHERDAARRILLYVCKCRVLLFFFWFFFAFGWSVISMGTHSIDVPSAMEESLCVVELLLAVSLLQFSNKNHCTTETMALRKSLIYVTVRARREAVLFSVCNMKNKKAAKLNKYCIVCCCCHVIPVSSLSHVFFFF